ncbi:Cysteine protease atg4 [Malassezia obtusa]|uniref:Cysteine protease n=1 Tax=Malassezia obtusa TaxID=76774 RepID=A0AAF0IUG9_9BASI|nr:Cysteine protease atg4 [Malassezia obtusa]
MSTDERGSSESAGTPRRASQRSAQTAHKMSLLRARRPRRLSLSRGTPSEPMPTTAPPDAETRSESAAMERAQPHTPQRSESGLDGPGALAAGEPVFPRRIVQWITRVANSTEPHEDTAPPTPPSAPADPIPHLPEHPQRRDVRRRHHHRITRPVPADAPGGLWTHLSDRMIPLRSPSQLWHLTSDRMLWPTSLDAGVWLLGTHYGATDAPEAPDTSSGDSTLGSAESASETSTARQRRVWRAELIAGVRSLVWCTYRSDFPPIAHDGYIGADEEATSAAVSAATEELCAPAERADAGATQPLTQLLARSNENLSSTAATRSWLLQQLESRGWQLPGLLAQLPITTGLLSRQEPVTPAAVASSVQAILDAVEHDVLLALRHPLAASVPIARLRESLVSHLGGQTGLPGLWSYVSAIYQSVSSIAQPTGLTSDTGWGCMLRTAQSLLACALLRVHLGATWRLPPVRDGAVQWRNDTEHAKYTRIVSLFFDDPSSACPFSIHRLAAEGKRLGIHVGEWFGPSTAASVLERLARHAPIGLGVVATNDGTVCMEEVTDASADWTRPVLVLIAQRLGLREVPKPYRAALKHTFTFPQSVGIAGGRPSSSVYFVGCQRENLLYLDPHATRPAVPFRHVPPSLRGADVLGDACPAETHALLTSWYCRAYSAQELATFRAPHAQLMPLGIVDPSLLFGFVVHSRDELQDLARRVEQLDAPLFRVVPRRTHYEGTGGDAEVEPEWAL